MHVPKTSKAGSPFPPIYGRPYPTTRKHSRSKEINQLVDEWLMKYWAADDEKRRAKVAALNLGGFAVWTASTAEFNRIVLAARLQAAFFITDDYIDNDKMHDCIPGLRQAASANGPMNPNDPVECCLDAAIRPVKATCSPQSFDQLVRLMDEYWSSNSNPEETFSNLDQYMSARRLDVGAGFALASLRYALDINLSDHNLQHPLVQRAEIIIIEHAMIANDLFSYAQEKSVNNDGKNIVRILQEQEKLSYIQAVDRVKLIMREKEQEYIPAAICCLEDHELGKDSDVRRWIAALPYVMTGNVMWSQQTARYKVKSMPEGILFPSITYPMEEMPADGAGEDNAIRINE